MKRTLLAALVVVSFVVAGIGPATASHAESDDCSFRVTVTDASGTNVTIEEEPTSVVVLQPSAAQTMWEIGAQDKVVGMPKNAFTSYLNGTDNKTNVAGEQSTVLQETVVNLSADVVLAPNITDNGTVESLRNAGQTVYYFELAGSLDDVYQKTLLTGHLTGACEGAQARTDEMRSTVESIRSNVSDREPPKVLYALGGGFTTGNGTYIHELITAAGGENIAASAGISGYDTISSEVIVNQTTDWIVIPEGRALPANDAVNTTTAITEDQILRVNPNYLNQAGPRSTIPLQRMAEAFHPEAFTQQTETATQTANATTETAENTQTATETPGESGPGFTVVVALVAALALALVGRRR